MKLTQWIRSGVAALVVLAAAGVASAQDAFTVSPQSGAIGQEITLTASDDGAFGPRRGRLVLNLSVGKRRRPPTAKVVSWSANEIVFKIHRAAAGDQDITVRPRGRRVPPLVVSAGVEVLPPQLTGRSGDTFFKGDTMILNGDNFGTVRGRVLLEAADTKKRGSRRPRVLSWSNNTVEVKLPTAGPEGSFDIVLSNFAGETRSMSPIQLNNRPPPITGVDRILAVFSLPDSRTDPVHGKRGDTVTYGVSGTEITIEGFDDKTRRGVGRENTITIVFDPGGPVAPATTYTGSEITSITYSYTDEDRRGNETSATYELDSEGEVRVLNVSGNRITGRFSGTLQKTAGDGPATIRILNGNFTATQR